MTTATTSNLRQLATARATQAEKADAWDRLMRSTGNDADAIQDAWEYLRGRVLAREDQAEEDLDYSHNPFCVSPECRYDSDTPRHVRVRDDGSTFR